MGQTNIYKFQKGEILLIASDDAPDFSEDHLHIDNCAYFEYPSEDWEANGCDCNEKVLLIATSQDDIYALNLALDSIGDNIEPEPMDWHGVSIQAIKGK